MTVLAQSFIFNICKKGVYIMNRDYWIKKWKHDKLYALENDRLKKRSYVYTPFPKANLHGFQNGDVRGLVFTDVLARYQRLQDKNVLFPTGCHSLCNTSFVENKKFSSIINDDISLIFNNQIDMLGVGVNEAKHIDMRHNEYLANLQQAFLDLYFKGYIEYKDCRVYYDKKNNKIYDSMINHKDLPVTIHKCFVLKVKNIIDEIIDEINQIECSSMVKEKLLAAFEPRRVMSIDLFVSNGSKLKALMEEPEYMGGISFIFLNPEFIDITDYVDINEYHSVFSYLEGTSDNTMFVFSGLFARNPLTGKEIPIFISTLFQCDVYLGIPGYDEDDRVLALEEELEIIKIINDNKLINSDFLDGLDALAARDTIINAFLDAEIADSYVVYDREEFVLSSLDNFGPLFPFLEDKDTSEIFSLEGHLPYAFSSKMRPVLPDNVDIVGTTMNGTINNLFTEGMCPIISVLYDDIGSIIPIFSSESYNELIRMNGISYMAIGEKDLYSSVLMPMIFYKIISREANREFPKLINKLEVFEKTIDIAQKDIKRANNNLVDFDKLFNKYLSDSIRMLVALSKSNEIFVFDTYQLDDLDKSIRRLYEQLIDVQKESSNVDYALFNLVKDVNSHLANNDVTGYAKCIEEFINKYVFEYGLSLEQTLTFIKLIFPLMPFLAEEVYKVVFNGKYSIMNEDWPN